jgi:hypothetical protein
MAGDSAVVEKVQRRRSPEDLAEWLSLSYAENLGDGQVLTMMVNSFQMTRHFQVDVSVKQRNILKQ